MTLSVVLPSANTPPFAEKVIVYVVLSASVELSEVEESVESDVSVTVDAVSVDAVAVDSLSVPSSDVVSPFPDSC